MDIKIIAKEYFSFIEQNTHFYRINDSTLEIVTPFVNAFGDGISFVIQHENNCFQIHDQGFTLWNLSNYGIDLLNKNSARYNALKSLLRYSGFKEENGRIFKNVSFENLSQAIHDMTQLLINIDFSTTSKNDDKNH